MASERVNRGFFRWCRKDPDSRPCFAVLWYIDPHTPFQWDPNAADWAGLDPKTRDRLRELGYVEAETDSVDEQEDP